MNRVDPGSIWGRGSVCVCVYSKEHSLPVGSLKDSGDNLTSPFQREKLPLKTFLFYTLQEKQKKMRMLIILRLLLTIKQVEGGLD